MGGAGDGHAQDGRDESEAQRLDRNYNEILQELRVTQTGVQILTGFLLTLPFTNRFAQITSLQRNAYLAIRCGSVLATATIIAPAAFHRVLFRRGQRRWIVESANHAARAGMLFLALTTSGVLWLVFDVVTNRTLASVAGGLALLYFAGLWVGYPLASHRGGPARGPGRD
jgi:hypothetical protein